MLHLPRTPRRLRSAFLLFATLLFPGLASAQAHPVSGAQVMKLTQQFLQVAPKRFIGSPGHAAADSFTARTPIGMLPMTNYIVKFPGKKDGIIVLVTHYETNYPLKDIPFVGANDGACTTALLIALGDFYRAHPPEGYSIWLVFDDGEEAIANPPIDPSQWTASNSLYGTRHLAAKWSQDGTVTHIKAVLIADMIGDKDLDIMEETNSTQWLRDDLRKAAHETNHTANVFKTSGGEDDDHMPFLNRGIPTIDIIDVDYGPHDQAHPDGYHHTAEDTIDKLSTASLQTSADLFTTMVKLINQR